MLREEGQIYPQEKEDEVGNAMMFWILTPSLFTYPKIECGKDPENSTHAQNVVEMRYDVICVVQGNVNSPVCKDDTSKSSNGEQHQESQCKQHGGSQPQGTTIKSSLPTEDFNSGRYCNNHGSTSEVSAGIYIQTYCIHVMSPHQESKNSNGSHCVHHSDIAEYRLTGKETEHVTHDTECRENLHVHLGVPKEPEQVLVQHHVSPSRGQEKGSVEVTVSQEHSQSSSEYWKTSNQLDAHKAKRPHKQGYTVKSHSLSTHVCNGYQEVYTSLDTSDTRNVQTKNSLVNRRSRMAQSATKRGVRCPTYPGTLFYQSTQQQQSQSPWQHPERYIIHTRKCHIGGSDHYGNKPVTKSPHKCRHYNEEQHQQSVSRDQHVVELPITCQDTGPCVALLHTDQLTHCCSHHTNPASEDKIQHSNVFSVGATAPAQEQIFQTRFSFHIFLCVYSLYNKKD